MKKQDAPSPVHVDGPALTATADALAWMDAVRARGGGTIFRAPFVFRAEDPRHAALRTGEPAPRLFSLDDSALGIPLADHVRRACKASPSCTLWLDVERGSRMPAGNVDFSVVAVSPFADEGRVLRLQVRRPTACLRIRAMPVLHCARGASRCARCAEAARQPESLALLDVCPDGDAARPTVELEQDGVKTVHVYDVLRRFDSEADARAFSATRGVAFIGAARRDGTP